MPSNRFVHLARAAAGLVVVLGGLALSGCSSDTITQKLLIGSSCSVAADCGTQPYFDCIDTTHGGYCTKACKSDPDCPTEAICAMTGDTGQCRVMCPPAICHKDFQCRPASSDMSSIASHAYCDLPPAADAGVP